MRVRSWTVAAGVAAGALALGGCVIDVEGREAVEAEEHVFAVDGVPDVDLSTFDGRIEVRGWDRPEVRVVVEKRAANRERLEEIEIEIGQSGDRVRVAARRRDAEGLRVTLSLGSNWRGGAAHRLGAAREQPPCADRRRPDHPHRRVRDHRGLHG